MGQDQAGNARGLWFSFSELSLVRSETIWCPSRPKDEAGRRKGVAALGVEFSGDAGLIVLSRDEGRGVGVAVPIDSRERRGSRPSLGMSGLSSERAMRTCLAATVEGGAAPRLCIADFGIVTAGVDSRSCSLGLGMTGRPTVGELTLANDSRPARLVIAKLSTCREGAGVLPAVPRTQNLRFI